MGLSQLNEEPLEEGEEGSDEMGMGPVAGSGRRGQNNNHRRSASLKSVVGTNGKVLSGGHSNELGAVRKGDNSRSNGSGSGSAHGVIR